MKVDSHVRLSYRWEGRILPSSSQGWAYERTACDSTQGVSKIGLCEPVARRRFRLLPQTMSQSSETTRQGKESSCSFKQYFIKKKKIKNFTFLNKILYYHFTYQYNLRITIQRFSRLGLTSFEFSFSSTIHGDQKINFFGNPEKCKSHCYHSKGANTLPQGFCHSFNTIVQTHLPRVS